ncbi:SixA phosphatase family protein [Microlunatus speluncae]|uniref:SixA phosphatase family protein n=1 Tax=Microlunatus speluncae TaxID=2594267 RepID=UPI0012661B35|nr:histidine phosphatase family protein [Microlunatus speluncae]
MTPPNDPPRRTLLLARHAKSKWGLEVDDHDRPLSGRGRRDGVALGEFLAGNGYKPDIVICSTATRARQTWERAVLGGAVAREVRYDDRIYEAWAGALAKLVRRLPEDAETALLIGHSPGLPELARLLADRRGQKKAWTRLETKYPTSGLAILQTDLDWSEAHPGTAVLSDFVVPRGSD